MRRRSEDESRSDLQVRLQARRGAIEQAALTRVFAIAPPAGADPTYLEGLRASVPVAIDYALEAAVFGEERTPPPPPALRAQARLAARHGVGLDVVLRRYLAGYTLVVEFVATEAERAGLLDGATTATLLQRTSAAFDRLLAEVSREHDHEAASQNRSLERQRTERIERLLAGELVDTSGFAYDFEKHHVGLAAGGGDAAGTIAACAKDLDCRLLLGRPDEATLWAWLETGRPLDPADVEEALSASDGADATVALGEPAQGLGGWRLTHHQAAAALPVALRRGIRAVRYADVVLLAAALQDNLLTESLRQLYLRPLEQGRDGGRVAHETLRAYFAADRNVSSAASALGVTRKTVNARLQAVEVRIGRQLSHCAAELEMALRLDEIGGSADVQRDTWARSPHFA